MKVSTELIERSRTAKGGWSRKQLAEWGVQWPPKKGWKSALERGLDPNKDPEIRESKEFDATQEMLSMK